jgi:hypothetical protein
MRAVQHHLYIVILGQAEFASSCYSKNRWKKQRLYLNI